MHPPTSATTEGRTARQARREARIRRGTRAPGPAPAGSGGDPALLPGPGETLDRLAGDFCILQLAGGHRYSTDDLLLAWFACEALAALGVRVERALDLGSGIGSVALLLAWRLPLARIDGLEAQPASVALARRSARYNGVEARVRFAGGDLRDPLAFEAGAHDLVAGTPPYFPASRGLLSAQPQRAACRFELRGGVEAYLQAAARALRPAGIAAVVQAWSEHERVLLAARAHGLGAALCQPVVFKHGKPPGIGLYAFTDRAVDARQLPPLVVRRADNLYSDEFRAVRRAMGYPLEHGFVPASA